ncbi:autotransporter outer membrane beta-barrel domain-containing protein [Helicobacter brantae]|uniref:Autotransporter domain-containing protein n=1 Tax=Helicobacter brantae TaxID=375927 RepID=A0A3D8J3S1_9HELI|nr:autotransporter outer membrane beta-barrel domain-containing protein [Helicobacter brantae]RDU72167.1 hypothetical protein CQA58_00755 [Helicobacter brantae]
MGGGVVTNSDTLSSQSSVAKPSRFFKPLVASSLALALGVSVGMAQKIGGDGTNTGDSATTTTDKYFVVDSGTLPNSPTLGTLSSGNGENGNKIDLIWSGASGLVYHDNSKGYGGSIKAKGVVVRYGTDNNHTLNITGSNASTTNFEFINSTFIGNILSQQNANTTNTFQGNGTYTGGDSIAYAFVGNIVGQGQGSNLKYNFTQGANFKGKIYGEAGTINVVFSNDTNTSNTLKGVIGREAGEGYTNVTFNNNATIQADGSIANDEYKNSGGNFLASFAGDGSSKNTLTLEGSTNNLTGNVWAGVYGGGSSATLIDIKSGATTTTLQGNISAVRGGTNTIQIASGGFSLTGAMSAILSNNKNSKSYNAIKFSNSATGTITGDITSNGAINYITNTGSGNITIGENDRTNKLQMSFEGGGSGSSIYITDYDSTQNGGFQQTPSTGVRTGALTLTLKQIIFENTTGGYQKGVGQNLFIDYNQGVATIDSGAENDQSIKWTNQHGNTVVMRFRDMTDATNSTITIGSSGNNNGKLSTSGNSGKALFQAHTINAYGNISSNYGSQTIVWGNQIDLHGGSITSSSDGETQKSKSIVVADGSSAVIKADSVQVTREGQAYILLKASTSAQIIGQNNAKSTFSLTSTGGGANNKIFITDYDSTENGFDESFSTNTSASFNLDTTQIRIANANSTNNDATGQTFVLDTYQGNAVINSGTTAQSVQQSDKGHTFVIRFRDKTSSSITIGQDGVKDSNNNTILNGNISANGTKAILWLEAKDVKVYGDIGTYGGTSTINAQTANVAGKILTKNGTLTITGTDTSGANALSAKAIYGHSDYSGNGTFTLNFSNGGSLTTALIAGNKWDGTGSASFVNTLTIDNSNATEQNVLISVIDTTSTDTLKVVGGSFVENKQLSNTGENGTINLNGNVAIFANTATSKNTISVKSNDTSTAHIVGDIITVVGENTIALSDSNSSGQTPAIIGNIQTNSGNTNISLENSLWAPNNLAIPTGTGNQALLKSYVDTYGTGEITTNGGRTTLVSRLGSDLVGTMDDTHPLVFKVNANGGESNIVMQITSTINLNTQAVINYANGVTNMVFANSNDGVQGEVVGGTTAKTRDVTTLPAESFASSDTDSSVNKFFGLTYQDGVKFKLENRVVEFGNESVSLVERYGAQFRALNDNGDVLTITSKRTDATDTGIFTGLAMGEISSLATSTTPTQKTYNNTLTANSAFVGSITLDTSSTSVLTMEANTKLILTGDKATMATLTLSGNQTTIDHNQLQLETLGQTNNRVINLATNGGSASSIATRENFRLLEIGSSNGANKATTGLLGEANESIVFMTYVNPNANQSKATLGGEQKNNTYGYSYADRIIIHNVSQTSSSNTTQAKGEDSVYMQFAVNADTNLGAIKYNDTLNSDNKGGTAIEGNVAILTVANSTTNTTAENALIKLETQDTLQGFDVIGGTIKGVATDANGIANGDAKTATGDYTTYFITSLSTTGADSSIQDTTASAFATSLDIFMANFNSLNKRMGELRNNDNSQGAWARVFGGAQSSSFGLGSKTSYVTTQAGYDYAFGFEGANNYLGVALAYSYASSSTSNATNTLNGVSEGIEGDLKSNMVEVALYNSYVQDEGWYNDSIFKFNYIMNSFSTTGTAMGNSVSTDTFGIILSDEFGYRFRLGGNNEWYIDPQAEFSFGYVNGTEYTLTSGYSTLLAKSDAMMQLRARAGSSFGYDFKNFTEGKAIKASVYVGAFYEYDYLNGGDVTLTTNLGGVNSLQSSLASDGRVVMNVGTNMTIKDNTRIYFDFEKSFAGKINTDYQVNVGVRYSFGENTSYTPMGVKKEVAPLKVSDENTQTPQESKESVEENSKQENAEQTQESKENKAQ